MVGIDRNSPVPLYFQLKQILLSKIQSGTWQPSDMIPGELEISEAFGLSRTTVRQTLGELVADGYLTRHRGRGTFVSASRKRKVTQNHDHVGLHESLSMQGLTPGWKLLEHGWAKHVPDKVLEHLNLKDQPEARVYRIVRLRLADDEILGWHQAWLQEQVAQRIDHNALVQGESKTYLLDLPEMKRGQATRTLESGLALSEDVDMLGVAEGSPMLQVERVVTVDHQPLEYMVARYPGYRFKYQISGSL